MTVRSLEEEFRAMGMSDAETLRSLGNMGMLQESSDDEDFEDFEDYDDDDDYDDYDYDDYDDDELDESARRTRTHKTSAANKRKSRKYYKANKMEILRHRKRRAKSSAGKRAAKMLARMPKGGAHVRRVVSSREMPADGLHESIMDSLGHLAESIEKDPCSRFDEYVEAFNHIADLGEIMAVNVVQEDNDMDAADDIIEMTVNAEDVLEMMEDFGGALDPEEDALLEEILEDAIEDVTALLEDFGMDDGYLLEAAAAKKTGRVRRAMKKVYKKAKGKKGKKKKESLWSKSHGKGDSRAQIMKRKDVDDPNALLNYLKLVKRGFVKPGHKVNRGALNAQRAKGKGYKGKGK